MGIAFGTAVTVFRNDHVARYKGTYNQIKLQDIENGEPRVFPVPENRFAQISTDNFSEIPGSPVAYWVSQNHISLFNNYPPLNRIMDICQGMKTADNNHFLRLWHEPVFKLGEKWYPYNKGGDYRRW